MGQGGQDWDLVQQGPVVLERSRGRGQEQGVGAVARGRSRQRRAGNL